MAKRGATQFLPYARLMQLVHKLLEPGGYSAGSTPRSGSVRLVT